MRFYKTSFSGNQQQNDCLYLQRVWECTVTNVFGLIANCDNTVKAQNSSIGHQVIGFNSGSSPGMSGLRYGWSRLYRSPRRSTGVEDESKLPAPLQSEFGRGQRMRLLGVVATMGMSPT